jgi:hypothetical protein
MKSLVVICCLLLGACSHGQGNERVTIENLAQDKPDMAITEVIEEKYIE